MTFFFHNSHSEPAIKRQFISILYNLFDNKSMRDTESRHNETFRSNCQLMLKRHTYMRWIFSLLYVNYQSLKKDLRPEMSSIAIMCQR